MTLMLLLWILVMGKTYRKNKVDDFFDGEDYCFYRTTKKGKRKKKASPQKVQDNYGSDEDYVFFEKIRKRR